MKVTAHLALGARHLRTGYKGGDSKRDCRVHGDGSRPLPACAKLCPACAICLPVPGYAQPKELALSASVPGTGAAAAAASAVVKSVDSPARLSGLQSQLWFCYLPWATSVPQLSHLQDGNANIYVM